MGTREAQDGEQVVTFEGRPPDARAQHSGRFEWTATC